MIQKIKHALLGGKPFFEEMHGTHDASSTLWWVGFASTISHDRREAIKKKIEFELDLVSRVRMDPEATFPFELKSHQTKQSRLALEAAYKIRGQLLKSASFHRPQSVELFLLLLDPISLRPESLISTLPVQINQDRYSCYRFDALEDVSVSTDAQTASFELGIETPLATQSITQLFFWAANETIQQPILQQMPKQSADDVQKIDEAMAIGDAGFEMDFNVQVDKS